MVDIAAWRIDMRRDDELIRKLMLDMEESPEAVHDFVVTSSSTQEDRRTYYHLRLLADAGLVEESGRYGGIFRMTSQGHDFVGMMRDQALWSQMKRKAREVVPEYGLKLLFEVGNGILMERLKRLDW